jgi:hypothetical protein
MSAEPPPANANGGYNPDDWTNANDPVDQQYLAQNYLQFPNAQGAETMGDLIVSGAFTAQEATFAEQATFNNGIKIGVGDLTFSDTTVQTTAFIEANYAQLNTDNVFLAPYQNTFAGNSSTGNTNAPLKITNGVVNSGNPEYCTMYLDPNSGYDMTLYTAQSTGGGLTVRSANGASYTLNPATIKSGVVGAQTLNPIDINGYDLYGFTYVHADVGAISFVDSSANPMLLLTNGGNTSYENLSMNYNDISNVNIVNFGGNNCKISNESDFNPNILNIANLSPYANGGSIWFTMYTNATNINPIMTMSPTSINAAVNIDLNGTKSINNAYNINGVIVSASSSISTPVVNVNTYSKISQNSANNATTISNNAPYNANLANITFLLNNTSGTSISPLQLYYNSVTANTTLTMSNNDITGIKNLSGNNGADIAVTGGNLSLVNNRITGVNTISGFQGANITMGNNINMNNTNIFNCGSLSTAFTQSTGTSNTTIATTQFVQNAVPTVRSFAFTQTSTSSVLQPSPCLTETIQQRTSVQFTNTYFTITIFGFFITAAVLEFDDLPWDTPPPTVTGSQYINGVLQSTLTSYQFYCAWSSSAPWTLQLIPSSTNVPTVNGSVYAFNLASLGIMTT